MSFLPLLTEEEIQYICSVIPQQDTITYFKHNTKEFGKICPGFRASSIGRRDIGNLLFNNRKGSFISFFIEEHISDWLSQIQEQINKCIENGDSRDLAYIHTLPYCFFSDNVAIYFKLIEDEHSVEYVNLLASAVAVLKEGLEERERLQGSLNAKESEYVRLQIELDSALSDMNNNNIKQNKNLLEIKTLKHSVSELEKLKIVVQNDKEAILLLEIKIQEQLETIQELRTELSGARNNQEQLELQIQTELEKQQALKTDNQKAAQKVKCPIDIDDFKDYLGYNFENIGIETNSEYFIPLKEHLGNILFQGMPIIINRSTGVILMKCITNALVGSPKVQTLVFKQSLSIEDIDDFILSTERVICLDNFIGNCNETELIPLLANHKNKIIFLTVAYDRTLRYISKEFLRYAHYLNLNRITVFSAFAELTEDPSTVEEIDCIPQGDFANNRFSGLLREILKELDFPYGLIEQRCAAILDEYGLCQKLIFELLPYCVDVLQIAPYNTSERLVKYAGDTGRCLYKNLFRGWFT